MGKATVIIEFPLGKITCFIKNNAPVAALLVFAMATLRLVRPDDQIFKTKNEQGCSHSVIKAS